MKLTKAQLEATVTAIKGTTMATLHTVTEPKMRKTGNPFFGRVKKHTKINVQIGSSYENGVNRQLGREGNPNAGAFKAQSLPWGNWKVPNKIIEHKGKIYVRATPNPQMVPTVEFTLDDKPIDKVELVEFLQERTPSARQEAVGVEREVKPVTYSIDSIVGITTGGTHYRIED